jgi:hypothetical protein
MSILILGGKGNMGQRYQAVLRHLRKDFTIADVDMKPADTWKMAESSEGIILATPTDTHTAFILSLAKLGKPILSEKPISKDVKELKKVLRHVKKQCPIAMVYQYGVIADRKAVGLTSYDYFKHGSDGLFWDCIQLVGLANGALELAEDSPIWKCSVNGKRLSLSQMDHAYIEFMAMWMRNPSQDVGGLIELHECVADLEQDRVRQDERNH